MTIPNPYIALFVYTSKCSLHLKALYKGYKYHYPEKETEAQIYDMTCQESPSRPVGELEIEPQALWVTIQCPSHWGQIVSCWTKNSFTLLRLGLSLFTPDTSPVLNKQRHFPWHLCILWPLESTPCLQPLNQQWELLVQLIPSPTSIRRLNESILQCAEMNEKTE